jgi:heme exporter protein A
VIRLDRVTRLYGDHPAVDDVSFEMTTGSFVALMGHNGAGKSTLLRIVAGLTRPTSGKVLIAGREMRRDGRVRRDLGFLAHESYLYGSLTPRENLRFYARLFDVGDASARVDALLEELGLTWAADLPIESFSRGMEQRAALARVLVHDPRLLLLDEPFAGLDGAGERFLAGRLDALHAAGKSALIVTHDPVRALRTADRVIVLRRGRIVLDEAVDDAFRARFPAEYGGLVEGRVRR